MEAAKKDHLFISYAGEDKELAHWLGRRLTIHGYHIWCDNLKLLGGESYPKDIDDAIKHRTFRLLALLSKNSIRKPNPLRERTIALNIADNQGPPDFLIPLNVDGLRKDELDWMTSDKTFIPFNNSWRDGLSQLIKKLESVKCPRPIKCGSSIVVESLNTNTILISKEEQLISNCLEFLNIPNELRVFNFKNGINRYICDGLKEEWPFYYVNPHCAITFHCPPRHLGDFKEESRYSWREEKTIQGIVSQNLVTAILSKSIQCRCKSRGLKYCSETRQYYFGIPLEVRLPVAWPNGIKTHVNGYGKRMYWSPLEKKPYLYHLSPLFLIRRDLFKEFVAVVHVGVHLTDLTGRLLPPRTRNSRRKHLTKDWWNKGWVTRVLAICQYLGNNDGTMQWGGQEEEKLLLSTVPVMLYGDRSINEEKLDKGSVMEASSNDEYQEK